MSDYNFTRITVEKMTILRGMDSVVYCMNHQRILFKVRFWSSRYGVGGLRFYISNYLLCTCISNVPILMLVMHWSFFEKTVSFWRVGRSNKQWSEVNGLVSNLEEWPTLILYFKSCGKDLWSFHGAQENAATIIILENEELCLNRQGRS